MRNIYVCKKTYTNGKDYEVHELVFRLKIVKEENGRYRIENIDSNTLWDKKFIDENEAVKAITEGNWSIIKVINEVEN